MIGVAKVRRLLVPAKPFLPLTVLLPGEARELPAPWRESAFFATGGEALIAALAALGIVRGARIGLPALICRSLPDRLVGHGFEPVYFDCAAELTASPPGLATWAEEQRVRVVVLVDYFGFLSEENDRWARPLREAGCLVVVDRCHSALSAEAASDEGEADAVIYSIRKTLSVRDGGALRLRGRAGGGCGGERPWWGDLRFVITRLAERAVCALGRPNLYRSAATAARRERAAQAVVADLSEQVATAPSWLLSRQLRRPSLLAEVARRRRQNYLQLEERARRIGLKPLFSGLPEGVVPQVLPLHDPSGELAEYLRESGVGAYRWPAEDLPAAVAEAPDRFPNAVKLNREMAYLPIHQSIGERHMARMIRLLERRQRDDQKS